MQVDKPFFNNLGKYTKKSTQSNNVNPKVIKFVRGSVSIDSTLPQKREKAYCDRQNDILVTHVSDYLCKSLNDNVVIIDYGCGEYGTLFFVMYTYLENKLLEKIEYFGLDILDFNKSNFIEYKKAILNFKNKNKSFENVFYNIDKMEKNIKADIVIIKNVLHEIKLVNLPEILSKVIDCVSDKGLIIIHDLLDMRDGEINNLPWDLDNLRYLLTEIYNFKEKMVINYNVPPEFYHDESRLPLFLYTLEKTQDILPKMSNQNLKKQIINLYNKRKSLLFKRRKELEDLTLSGKLYYPELYIKYKEYYGNCCAQIEEAEKEWF